MTKHNILGLLLFSFLLGCGSKAEQRAQHEDPALLLNRVWIDSKPQKYTDYVHAMLAVDYAPIGLFQKASNYDIHTELFEYKRSGDHLRVYFPQRDRSADVAYHIRACDDLPPFDLCLDLSQNPWGGPRRYHGLRDSEAERRELGALRSRAESLIAPRVP